MNDWSHRSAFQDFEGELIGKPPPMQSVLLNGTGMHRKLTRESIRLTGEKEITRAALRRIRVFL